MTAISSAANVVINSEDRHNSIGFQVLKTSKRQHKFNANGKHRTNTILKELPISVDDLTQEDITLYAKQIGIDPGTEPDLLWIAKKGLIQTLPFPWIAVEDQIGRLYYFNVETEESRWEHPCDQFYRSLAQQLRLKGSKGSSTTLSMSGLTSIANLHFVDEDLGFRNDGNGNSQHSAHKKSTQIDGKDDKKELSFTNIKNNNSDEEVESVDFELEVEEALEELSSNGAEDDEDLLTLDVTEGGANDIKQFKEVHAIDLSESVVNNEFKYRIDNKTSADSSRSGALNSTHAMKDKMQISSDDDYQSSEPKVIHKSNIKQSTGVSTGGKDTETTVRHNEISDEFLLDESTDPFAEFDGYDQNYNDLFGSLGISGGSGMPSKYDNSDNYDQTTAKPLSNSSDSQTVIHSTPHNISHKPLETLREASEERDENESESSADEAEVEEEVETRADDEEDNENVNEVNEQQIEYKFEEMTKNLTEKISSLRLELRNEIQKQRNTINRELNDRVNDLDDKISKNVGSLSDTKTEIHDLRQMFAKTVSRVESSAITSAVTSAVTSAGPAVKSTDIDRLGKEMQLLRSDVRNESLDSIRELRNELNRDIKSKVNSVFNEFDNKFMDFKEENGREFKSFKTELFNISNNSKNFGQQMIELRNDLSQTLADIERQRKEHNKRLERMDSNLSEETQRFQSEVLRLQTLLKTIEDRVQELDTERHEIRLLSRLETTEQNNSECKARIDTIDKQVLQLTQSVYQAFKTGDNQNNNKSDANDDNRIPVVVNRAEQLSFQRDMTTEQTVETGKDGVTDDSPPKDILNRMSTIEKNIKRISDSFEQMIPIINHNKDNKSSAQNRNTYLSRKRNETNSKTRLKVNNANYYSDEDEYTSRTTSSLVSSSSISDGRARQTETSAGKRRQTPRKRCSHHSIPIKSNKSDVHIKGSHKCCIHKDDADQYYHRAHYPAETNYRLMKVPLMPTGFDPRWQLQQQSTQQLKHIRSSSTSLLSLIKKTSKKLREEAIELEGLGNYRFVTDFEPIVSPFKDVNDVNNDETAIKKLKSVRLDVDQKLRKVTNVINQQKSSQI